MTPNRSTVVLIPLLAMAAFVHAQSADAPGATQTSAPIVRTTPKPKAAPITGLPQAPKAKPTVTAGGTAAPTPKAATSAATPKPAVPKPVGSAVAAKPAAPTVVAKPVAPAAPAAPVTGPMNRLTIVLDPAHGGVDTGSRLTDNLVEKDITLALAFKLRSLLTARGFSVVMVRDSDSATPANKPDAPLTLDDRAGIANHSRAVACLLLHATGSGTGVHLYNSGLDPAAGEATSLPWLTAQAAWVQQSRSLSQKLGASLSRSSLPLVSSAASVRPVDSLTCPALVVELAPATAGDPGSISDGNYQQRVAEAIANAMVFWKTQAVPPTRLDVPSPMAATTNAATTASVTPTTEGQP